MVYALHLKSQYFFVIDDKFLSCTRPISRESQRDDPFAASLHLSQDDGLGLTIDVLHTYRARTPAKPVIEKHERDGPSSNRVGLPPQAWPTGLLAPFMRGQIGSGAVGRLGDSVPGIFVDDSLDGAQPPDSPQMGRRADSGHPSRLPLPRP